MLTTDDIVKRLREGIDASLARGITEAEALMDEAADEIELLRKSPGHVIEIMGSISKPALDDLRRQYRDRLQGGYQPDDGPSSTPPTTGSGVQPPRGYSPAKVPSATLIQQALVAAKVELEFIVKMAEARGDNGPVVRGQKEALDLIGRALTSGQGSEGDR